MRKLTTLITKTSTQPTSAKSPKGAPHTLNHTTPSRKWTKSDHHFSPFPSSKSSKHANSVFFSQVTPSQITTGEVSKLPQLRSLKVRSQTLPRAPACGYKSNALAVHRYPSFTALSQLEAHLESSLTFAVVCFCGNSQCLKVVGCFLGGAPSLMFGRILNAALPNTLYSSRKL